MVCNGNWSLASTFIVVGFEAVRETELFLFCLFLLMYVITIGAHLLIIGLVAIDKCLHKPMYVFLTNFSVAEIAYITATIPKMLDGLLTRNKEISYSACLVQFYFFFAFGATENCFLVVMGYDRYVAICQPLHYTTMMAKRTSLGLTIGAWASGLMAATSPAIWVSSLKFCYPNQIDHFFCDYAPLLKLSCEDTSRGELTFTVLSWTIVLGCFFLTLVSYALIIHSVLKIPSVEGQKKAFSTCASHLTVVSIFNGTVIFVYLRPTSTVRFTFDKVISIFYCLVTPLMNPIIYCLRNTDVKNALYKVLKNCRATQYD
ncbi:olfactory receptor 6N1-like [Bufo gargarizans]|uniref:olfactory receptor 6N1-like n=1 Tax=Bufo gargarizans TaxID=30331 RepID=UPI001CF1E394|nr:olfactory receptor 6N1-like [Bufo gargarizans]